jgi:hypothetical protein
VTTYNAVADLGLTPGTDVTSALATFFSSTAAPGDVLNLDSASRFRLTWNGTGFDLPINFTISAVNGGGFDIRSSTTAGGHYFYMNDGCLFSNVTFRAPLAPVTGYRGQNAVAGTDYDLQRAIGIGGTDCIVRNCDLEGQIEMWLEIEGGAHDALIEGNRFFGGKYQNYVAGDVRRPRWYRNYFEYGMIDAIKTVMSNAKVPSGWVGPTSDGIVANLEENDFVEINREPLDSTGGAYKFVLDGNRAFRCALLDLKHPIKELNNPSTDSSSVWNPYTQYGNVDMVVRNTYIQDYPQNAFVFTTDTPAGSGITQANYDRLNVRNIAFENVTWEFTTPPTSPRLGLLKGGDSISLDGLSIRGYTGSYTVWLADYDAGQGQVGDAPSGWTPDVAPTAINITTNAANISPLPTPLWQKVGGAPPPTTIELLGAVISVTATAV